MQLTANWLVSNGDAPNRLVTITARTGSHAVCSLSDSVSGVRLHGTATATGRLRWRWRPSVWANGPDTVKIGCVKGPVQKSTETFFLLGSLEQISVIRDYALHIVYWAPAGDLPADVAPAVMQLETDVKASLDAGAVDNPFAIPRAYGDSLGSGDPRIATIDVSTDSNPYPAPPKSFCPSPAPCLGASTVGNEVTRLARAHGWAGGNRALVMVFTSPALAVCYTRPGQSCSMLNEPCGYHALTGGGYAYAEVIMSAMNRVCTSSSPADYAVALIDHEQNEAIVDSWGSGVEVGDPCDSSSKSVPINGHTYDVQALLENGKCAFGYTGG